MGDWWTEGTTGSRSPTPAHRAPPTDQPELVAGNSGGKKPVGNRPRKPSRVQAAVSVTVLVGIFANENLLPWQPGLPLRTGCITEGDAVSNGPWMGVRGDKTGR